MPSRNFRYRLEDMLLRALVKGVSPLGVDRASNAGAGLLRWLHPLLKKANKAALASLTRVFPEDEAKRLLPEIWANLGRVAFEYPYLRTELATDPSRIEFEGEEVFARLKETGKGCIFLAAHLGNWELFPMVFDRFQSHVMLIYRAPNNPHTRDLIQDLRPAKGVTFVPKSSQGMRRILAELNKGRFVGFLTDHRYNETLPVDFLGGKARLAPTAALLARRFGAPIVFCRSERLEGARFKVTFTMPMDIEKGDASPEIQQELTQMIAARFEGWIKERPDQWFWMQKLWAKTDNS